MEKKMVFFKIVRMVQETEPEYFAGDTIREPREAAEFIKSKIGDYADEVFGVILLDNKHKPTGWGIVATGSVDHVNISPRNILVPALTSGARAVILFHNHPSGDPEASLADMKITKAISEAAKLVEVKVLDHIIIGNGTGKYNSVMRDHKF